MRRSLTLWICLGVFAVVSIGCSSPSAVEGTVDVTSPDQVKRKHRHVFKSEPPATQPK